METVAARLKRERSAARSLRQKSKAVATRKAVVRMGESGNSDSVRASDKLGVVGFVVYVRGLNKAERKAFRHFLQRAGIAWKPVEFRADNGVVRTRATREDTGCSAYLCFGRRTAFRAVFAHKYVTGIERPGTVTDRYRGTLGPPVRPVRPGPKHKRPAGYRYVVTGSEWCDEEQRQKATWQAVR